jgi:hypothetical protein
VLRWFVAFAFTQIVEIPLWTLALRRWSERRRPTATNVAIAFGASALTHPIVWFGFPRLVPHHYLVMVALAEAFAVIAEALYTRAFGLRRAFWVSLVVNGASAGLGLLSREAFGWP